MYSTVLSACIDGISACRVTVEADVSDGLPTFSLVGFLASETREAAERVRSALRNSGFRLGAQHITVNLSPASLHKRGSLFDLAIAAALLGSYGFFSPKACEGILFLGELGLNGAVLPVHGVLEIVSHAADYGCSAVIVPARNLAEASVVRNVRILGAQDLNQVVHFLMGKSPAAVSVLCGSSYEPPLLPPPPLLDAKDGKAGKSSRTDSGQDAEDFSQVHGQALARRAAEIAVSGFHSLLLIGPPGAGKTMIARRIAGILPRMTTEEALEITKIHSVAGILPEGAGLLSARPFRSPHHTVTSAALCGGGTPPKPGEISLAHRGVLYLDEMAEFDRAVLDTLRQPAEEHIIRISRASGTFTFPAGFMLVASMNPCPCGYFPDRSKCTCTNSQIRRYLSHISQPMLDRIDMCTETRRVAFEDLSQKRAEESSETIRKRVAAALAIQEERYRGKRCRFNADLNSAELKTYCRTDAEGQALLRSAYETLSLTARSYGRILKVARTIADLDGSEMIRAPHLAEAVSFRAVDRKYWDSALN